ncbi:hypothetical protein F5148DRAFT_1290923 [Russula earlei]|uniref:Uncharacterized protein n=1 Tax=Russula earlei TaxID=71964 RepID=A0ACC0TW69_9AGAM|nr:hypothetical protein F5148DRAFT_1290923 [Russula earlei]
MRDSKLLPSTRPSSPPRSWRRTVADALALAQSAVELDSKDTDPKGALAAYAESVRRLRCILARLERHGAYAEASQLSAISDGYSERMRLLCVACSVPPPPYDAISLDDYSWRAPPPSPPPPVALLPPPPYEFIHQ